MKFSSKCSGCFAGLSCGSRIDILKLLQNGKKLNVTEIAKHFRTSQPTISHHLLYLKEMGILKSKRDGRQILYFIDPKCGFDNCELFKK